MLRYYGITRVMRQHTPLRDKAQSRFFSPNIHKGDGVRVSSRPFRGRLARRLHSFTRLSRETAWKKSSSVRGGVLNYHRCDTLVYCPTRVIHGSLLGIPIKKDEPITYCPNEAVFTTETSVHPRAPSCPSVWCVVQKPYLQQIPPESDVRKKSRAKQIHPSQPENTIHMV